ncbi:MAG: Lrp/AsnC family transcriptional regulator [Ruminococcaceae bacterium]|nr:Lrp/AsnC family transcriptional regulator [Oscillospiraceae bacterium]
MDNIDKQIISMLQKNARTPLKTLAEKVELSSPSVSARIKQLEKDGVISGYRAEVDPAKLGCSITAFINIAMESRRKLEFYEFAEKCPNVTECNSITGDYSVLIKVSFPSTYELDAFVGEIQKFGKTQTTIVFSTPIKSRGINIEIDNLPKKKKTK